MNTDLDNRKLDDRPKPEQAEVFDDHPLNTSDHLPLHTSLEVTPAQSMVDTPKISQVNWSKVDNNSISQYQNAINGLIRPLIGNTYDDIGEVEREMKLVSMGIWLYSCFQHVRNTRLKLDSRMLNYRGSVKRVSTPGLNG